MVKIYTDKKFLTKPIMETNDAYFDEYVKLSDIQEAGKLYMWSIDEAEILDAQFGSVVTPFGATVKERLSTGLKTVLNLLYMIKNEEQYALDITECGPNALDAIFDILEKTDNKIQVYLWHGEVAKCKEVNGREYCVNNGEPLPSIMHLAAVI